MESPTDDLKDRLLDAALAHVPFDGWSEATFRAAVRMPAPTWPKARFVCPRGAVDLALALPPAGDEEMGGASGGEPARPALPRPDRAAVRFGGSRRSPTRRRCGAGRRCSRCRSMRRWGEGDLGHGGRDLGGAGRHVRRLQLVHQARDAVGRLRRDGALLAGRRQPENRDTWAFLDRRIEDVMRIEKVKAEVRKNPCCRRLAAGPEWVLSKIKPPSKMARMDLPGFRTKRAR
jgi:ubiquinone biosynthesis protein COQ9